MTTNLTHTPGTTSGSGPNILEAFDDSWTTNDSFNPWATSSSSSTVDGHSYVVYDEDGKTYVKTVRGAEVTFEDYQEYRTKDPVNLIDDIADVFNAVISSLRSLVGKVATLVSPSVSKYRVVNIVYENGTDPKNLRSSDSE